MNRTLKLTCAVLAAAPLAWPTAAAWAQNPQGSVQDFRLEPGEPTPPPDVQGPVDADAPIRVPTPSPTPAPPPPSIAVPPPTAAPTIAVPPARPTAAAPAARPSPDPADTPAAQQPVATPDEAPTTAASPSPAYPDLAPPAPTIDSPSAPVEAEPAPVEEGPSIAIWLWLALAAAVLLAGAAWFLLRRRQPQAPVLLEPAPRPSPSPEPEPTPAPKTPPTPATAQAEGGLNLQLAPRSLSASLFMATLQYRIELENTGTASLGPIAIAGDMIAAHASRNPQEQLAAAGQDLAEIYRVEQLQPGQRVELTGEIRLPLSAITPIRQGRAMLFVPLVRIYATDTHNGRAIGGGTFVIGEPPATPGGRLRPFRLDLGPRVYPTVEQRKLAMADAIPLDGRAMAG